jgi:pyruvate-ferredoxin/flavodoxin oxidoreductase
MKAFAEAEAHKGVSLIVAYAPCVMQGISDGMSCAVNEARLAVDVGYWPLYRYTPETELPSTTDAEGFTHLAQHGKLTLDSKKIKGDLEDFLKKENRFNVLTRKNPEASARLHHHLKVRHPIEDPVGICTIKEASKSTCRLCGGWRSMTT